jgi:osmoprotectant transport system permease protein
MLALVVDRLLAIAEAGIVNRSRLQLAAAVSGLLVVAIASLLPFLHEAGARPIVVGTKNFEEQYILGALIEDRLREAGFATDRRDGLGSTVIFDALASGDIDVYVDYSGTIWADDMKRADVPGRNAVITQMAAWLKRTRGIGYVGALGFENAYAFAMRRDRAQALGIRSLADLASYAPKLRIGGDFEIFSRPEWRAVERAYDLRFGTEREYQPSFLYRAVASGDVDVISAFSSDGRIAQYGLKVLSDPKAALPPYDAVILVSPAQAGDTRLIATLKPLLGGIDLSTMQRANLMADRDLGKRTPAEIAASLDAAISMRTLRR